MQADHEHNQMQPNSASVPQSWCPCPAEVGESEFWQGQHMARGEWRPVTGYQELLDSRFS